MLLQPPPSFPTLDITLSLEADRATADLTGELDYATAAHLHEVIDQLLLDDHRHITLQLSGLEFLSASGIGAIAQGAAACILQGGSLALTGTAPHIRRVLRLTDQHHLITDEP